jgi:hypothetical protein
MVEGSVRKEDWIPAGEGMTTAVIENKTCISFFFKKKSCKNDCGLI